MAGTDGSEASRLAIREAGALAQQSGRSVVLVFVRESRYQATSSVLSVGALAPLQECLDGEQTIAQAQGIAVLDALGVPWSFELRYGQPATELMKAATAHEAETIVVAGRRHGAIGSVAHSSVTAQLLHRWPHALLVVRPSVGSEADPKSIRAH